MNEDEQFSIYHFLLMLALENPNEVFNICNKAIVTMSIINNHSEEDFDEILAFMKEAFMTSPSLAKVMQEIGKKG